MNDPIIIYREREKVYPDGQRNPGWWVAVVLHSSGDFGRTSYVGNATRQAAIDCLGLDVVEIELDFSDEDPTLWCIPCGARTKEKCKCLPISDND
jgi:hypothetical protein